MSRPDRSRRKTLNVVCTLLVMLSGCSLVRGSSGDQQESVPARPERVTGMRPCQVPRQLLQRVWRGYVPERSGDVLTIEWEPNQFAGVRHSTPFPYTQDVPVVLYGPGFIKKGFRSDAPVTVADLAPTAAKLLGYEGFPKRDGRPLTEALLPEDKRNGVPRLIFTLVWDGGGDDLLRQWPDAWPNLKQLMADGANFTRATVGSSPSITPAIHANIGTGAFPKTHGHADMKIRIDDEIVFVWEGNSPKYLRTETLSDLWDADNGNAPLIGMMARDSYHLGMIGHGAYLPQGDRDIGVIENVQGTNFKTNDVYYSLPSYLENENGLQQAIAEVDQRDGSADNKWRGNKLEESDPFLRYTPVWPIYQTKRLVELLTKEGFGSDEVPDLFYTNYKATDLAGHYWNLVEPEERDVLQEQDRQLPIIIGALNRLVGKNNYVLMLTADHGITPYPQTTNGWPIDGGEVQADINREFDGLDNDNDLVLSNRGYSIFLDDDEMQRNGVSAEQVARFVRNYRLGDNVPDGEEVPPRFSERTEEHLFMTALTPAQLEQTLSCARPATPLTDSLTPPSAAG